MSGHLFAVGPDHDTWVPSSMTVVASTSWATVAVDPTNPFVDHHVEEQLAVVVDGDVYGQTPASLAAAYRADPGRWDQGLRDEAVIVILDEVRRRIIARRDQIGLRPLFLAREGGRVVGTGSLSAFPDADWIDRRPDHLTVAEMIAAPIGHERRTVHRGIERLEPGTIARVSGDGSVVIERDRPFDVQPHRPELDEAVEQCRVLFDHAVGARLEGRSSAAVEVSGGLDSSTVAGTVARTLGHEAVLGRLVYDDPRADERDFSDSVARHLDLPVMSVPPTIPTIEELDEWTSVLRHPVPPINALMTISLRRSFAGAGHRRVLTGVGGDDAFAAMPIGSRVISAVQQRDRAELVRLARWAKRHPTSVWPKLVRPTLGHLVRSVRIPASLELIEPGVREAVVERWRWSQTIVTTGVRAIDVRARPHQNGTMAAQLDDLALLDEFTGTRLSHPFFDPDVMRFAYGLPPSWCRIDGVDRSLQRRAFADRLPADVAGRTSKAEFSETAWRFLLQPGLVDRVLSGPLMDQPFVAPDRVRQLLEGARQRQPGTVIPADAVVRIDSWLRVQP